jgi:hypothetical protein
MMAHMRASRANDRLLGRLISVSRKRCQCSMQLRVQFIQGAVIFLAVLFDSLNQKRRGA